MSLIICPECNKQVSSNADVCINCGNPLQTKPVEIEQTNKRYKKRAIFLVTMLIISFFCLLNGKIGIGLTLFLIALFGGMINRFMAWWNNG